MIEIITGQPAVASESAGFQRASVHSICADVATDLTVEKTGDIF